MVEQSRLNPSEGGGSNPAPPLQIGRQHGPRADQKDLLLEFCSYSDPRYQDVKMKGNGFRHYVPVMPTGDAVPKYLKKAGKAKGCHGKQVHYLIWYKGNIAGIISGADPVFACSPRDAFFHIKGKDKAFRKRVLNGIIDNTEFKLLQPHEENLGSRVLSLWEKVASLDWKRIYGVVAYGFETFIQPEGIMEERVIKNKDGVVEHTITAEENPDPTRIGIVRLGGLYTASNWKLAGKTFGSTKGHDTSDGKKRGLTGGLEGNPYLRKKATIKNVYCKWAKGYTEPVEIDYISSWRAGSSVGTPEEKLLAKDRTEIRKSLMGKKRLMKGKNIVDYDGL